MDNYYYLDANNQRHGPVAADKLVSLGVDANTLVWKPGLASWTKAGEVAELGELFMPQPAPQPQPEPVVQAESIQQPQQSYQHQPAYQEPAAYQQPALSLEPASAAPGNGNDSVVPTTKKNNVKTKASADRKKMLFIAGGVLMAALLAVGAIMLFHGSSGDDLFGDTGDIVMPHFQKFVVATSYAYDSPSTSAPRLMECYDPDEEGGESDGSWIAWEGQSLGDYNTSIDPLVPGLVPVIDEQDGWYKVWYSGSRWGGSAYRGIVWVEKSSTKDVKLVTPPFEPSPKADKYKDYKYELDEGGGDLDPILIRHTEKANIELKLDVTDWNQKYELVSRFDNYWEGLTDEEFEQLIPYFSRKAVAIEVKAEDADGTTYDGYFFVDGVDTAAEPSVTVQSQPEPEAQVEEIKTVVGYYVDDVDGEQKLMAQYGQTTGYTGVTLMAPLVGTADFDGDGNMDALIQNGYPGSSGVYSFSVVYFDGQALAFKEVGEIETLSDSPVIEDWNGKKTITVRLGLNTTRYALQQGEVKKVEDVNAPVGRVWQKVSKEELLPQQSGEHTNVFYADIDGDGMNDDITFFMGEGHPYGWGAQMSIECISYADGKLVSKDALQEVSYGAEFAFLETKTNGLSDILVDGSHYFRWNGYKYQEWIWNGSEFVVEN